CCLASLTKYQILFLFTETPSTHTYTLSLHDALPISSYKEDWGKSYEAGQVILPNRYVTSNAVHQASKLPAEEREEFLRWLFDLEDRKSTRLNSSHVSISYAVFCLKKKNRTYV